MVSLLANLTTKLGKLRFLTRKCPPIDVSPIYAGRFLGLGTRKPKLGTGTLLKPFFGSKNTGKHLRFGRAILSKNSLLKMALLEPPLQKFGDIEA